MARRETSVVTSIRLLPDERRVILQMAEDRGLSRAEFIRALVRQTLIEDMETDSENGEISER